MSQRIRLHILEAADWKDGIITLLEPTSPYRPWQYAFGESRPGDYAIVVLGTDPASVLTKLARIDHEGPLGGALLRDYRLDLVDLTTLAMVLDLPSAFDIWRFDDDDAERAILALHETPIHGRVAYRWGHSSVAAARILLRCNGKCACCAEEIDLSGHDARDRVHVHTVDPIPRPVPDSPIRTYDKSGPARPYQAWLRESARDWPGVLCDRCHVRMRDGHFRSLIDFQFNRHPACGECGARRTQSIGYGMAMDPESWAPWRTMGGCCPREETWRCEVCLHEW